MHPPEADDSMPPSTDVAADATAPDGTGLEVHRNYGKPSTAAEIAKALREQRKAKARKAKAPQTPPVRDEPKAPEMPTLPEPPAAAQMEQPALEPAPAPKPKPLAPQQLRSRKEAHARFAGMKPMHVVEAALFSAGKPLLVDEIAATTGLRAEVVKDGIKDLQQSYEGHDSVLEVGKAGAKWAMQVRSRAAEPAAKFAPMEIPVKVLKTLALIAYHQPMKQSELVDMIGTKVYDHVPELVTRGLVRAREEGVTKILVTTPAFPEYFGLDAEDAEGVRAALAKLVGLPPPPPKAKQELVFEETQAVPEPTAAEPVPESGAGQAAD